MKKGFITKFVVLIGALSLGASSALFNTGIDIKDIIKNYGYYSKPIQKTKQKDNTAGAIMRVEQKLKMGLSKTGVSPSFYNEVKRDIDKLEKSGVKKDKIVALKTLLEKLAVGGKKEEQAFKKGPVDHLTDKEREIMVWQREPEVVWVYQDKWVPTRKPPECPSSILEAPVDVSKATSILYPGQIRGSSIKDYKAHGGFRFDNQYGQNIEVRSPIDGYVFNGIRFLQNGQIQYGFTIINECGIKHVFGHLYELSPKFFEFTKRMPEPKEGDSRSSDSLKPFIKVKKGELIATKVGLPGNAGMDWGVYDLRKENESSKNLEYRKMHDFQRAADFHGLCWIDLLVENQKLIVKALPGGDGKSGKTSDYCK